MEKIEKIARCWDVSCQEAAEIIERMTDYCVGDMLSADELFAGVIDDDDVADKLCGHTGFWLAEKTDEFVGGGHIVFITNSDSIDVGFTEEVAETIGVEWTDFDEAFEDYKIA
jgi:hypothetical protein